MIAAGDVRRIFKQELPDVQLSFVTHDVFMTLIRLNPFIQAQCEAGIYTHDNLDTEILSSALAFPALNVVTIDTEQMLRLMEGVPRREALGWIRWTARHERLHFELGHYDVAPGEHADNELAVNRQIEQHYPRLHTLAQQAEKSSHRFQTVLDRIS